MNINVSEIINQKLEQLEQSGVIQRKIEESLEKAVLSAVQDEINSYRFRDGIHEQLREAVASIAKDCGLGAYNGFIAQRCRDIVSQMMSADLGERVQQAISDIMIQKHENIKLSDIFKRYRKWVLEHTEEYEKYERREFTHVLEEKPDGNWTTYICKFADHVLEDGLIKESPEIEIRLYHYNKDNVCPITSLFLDGHYMRDSFKVCNLTEFEAFVLNLYYNGTKIVMDIDDVDEDPYFDVDC